MSCAGAHQDECQKTESRETGADLAVAEILICVQVLVLVLIPVCYLCYVLVHFHDKFSSSFLFKGIISLHELYR